MNRPIIQFFISSLLAPAILMLLVTTELKSFIMPPQAVSFMSCSLQTPVYYDQAWRGCDGTAIKAEAASGQSVDPSSETAPIPNGVSTPSEPDAGAYDWGASYYIFQLRYLIFKPAFDMSTTNLLDLNKVASFQIVGFFFFLVIVMIALSKQLGRIDPLVTTLFLLVLFILMNGRAAPAFLGYALIGLALLVRTKGFAFEILALIFVAVGLFLSVVSTGLYISSFTLYVLGFLPVTGRILSRFQPVELDVWQKCIITACHLMIIGTGMIILVPLFIRLVVFYGTGTDLLVGVFSHGIGSFIGHPIPFTIAVSVCLVIIIIAINYAWRKKNLFRQCLANHQSVVSMLFIALVPLPYVVFGYTAALTSAVGFALLLGRLSFNIRSRGVEATRPDSLHQ